MSETSQLPLPRACNLNKRTGQEHAARPGKAKKVSSLEETNPYFIMRFSFSIDIHSILVFFLEFLEAKSFLPIMIPELGLPVTSTVRAATARLNTWT